MKRQTRYPKPTNAIVRIIGPKVINGMNVYNVVDLRTGESVGPAWTCFSLQEAKKRARDVVYDRKVIYFNNTPLVRKKL